MLRKALLLLLLALVAHSAHAAPNGDDPRYQACIQTAATAFKVHPLLIKVLLDVEGGRPGTASANTNKTHDYGPMQINGIWFDDLARFGITPHQIRYDACINIYAGTWIFMTEYARVKDVGLALANYHSKTARHQARYLGLIERAIARRMASIQTAAR